MSVSFETEGHVTKKKSSTSTGPKANKSLHKRTIKDRTDTSNLVVTKAPSSPLWQAQPALQDAGTKLGAVGTSLATHDAAVIAAKKTLATATGEFETAVVAWNTQFDVYVALSEQLVQKPEDLAALGLTALARNAYALAEPLAIDLKVDHAKNVLRIHVKLPPGIVSSEVEISDPAAPGTFRRLVGTGARRTITNPAPGTYFVHAASVRSNQQSAFFGPVSIVVK